MYWIPFSHKHMCKEWFSSCAKQISAFKINHMCLFFHEENHITTFFNTFDMSKAQMAIISMNQIL